MRWLWFILFLLLWLIGGWKFWDLKTNQCCDKSNGDAIGVVEDDKAAESNDVLSMVQEFTGKEQGAVLFNWGSDQPILGDRFTAYRDSIAGLVGEGQALEIQGQYFDDEVNNTSFDNLGLARANKLKNQFLNVLDASKINTVGRKISLRDGVKDYPFIASMFRSARSTAKIKEVDNTAKLYFGYNSSNRINDAEITAYLKDVADRVKKSGERITLVGHTDNTGDPSSNMNLGNWRATAVKNELVRYGVAEAKIATSSRGENDPDATNSTNAGRKLNRRVELTIN